MNMLYESVGFVFGFEDAEDGDAQHAGDVAGGVDHEQRVLQGGEDSHSVDDIAGADVVLSPEDVG